VAERRAGGLGGLDPAWVAVAAACLCFVGGFGLGRFAFALVNPVMTGAGWLTPAEAAAAGSRDLLGYIAGVLLARRLVGRYPATRTAVGSLILTALCCVALAFPFGQIWVSVFRFIMGAAVAFIMISAPAAALSGLPPERRTLAGGFIFAGVGLGIFWGGLLVPVLAPDGPATVMLGLAVAVLLTAVAATALPSPRLPPPPQAGALWTPAMIGTTLAYGAAAFAFVPHTVFWGDFVARAQGQGLGQGGVNQVLFGLGAMLGPALGGALAARIGVALAFRLYLVGAGLILLVPLVSRDGAVLMAVALLAGMMNVGLPALASARLMEQVGPSGHAPGWATMTLIYAGVYGIGGQVLAALFALTGSHLWVFFVASLGALVGVMTDVIAPRFGRRRDEEDEDASVTRVYADDMHEGDAQRYQQEARQ
jgi:hypothetical protein